jgi:arginyl-tRNA synthetase
MSEQLTFKGRPLVRSNNEIYYGSPTDSHVVFIQILGAEEKDGVPVANKVHVQLLSNDPALGPKARIIKQSDKTGLYSALDIGYIWLERALSGL